MISQSCAIAGTDEPLSDRVHCAMLDYAEFHGQWDELPGLVTQWQRLTNACEQMGVPVQEHAHRAHADVLMTLGLMRAIAAYEEQEGGAGMIESSWTTSPEAAGLLQGLPVPWG
jgi:DNA polymerase III epsilon subunit-like protein